MDAAGLERHAVSRMAIGSVNHLHGVLTFPVGRSVVADTKRSPVGGNFGRQ
tara:strand:- start:40050 stop:40202 length:153 start_codon:yes stop_codon:yes gene_type:complete